MLILDKSFGYETVPAINWTKNGGWIGQWGCPDGKGKCFGIGVVGSIDKVKPIIDSYKSQALQIFFLYPKFYNPNSSQGTGELLMIFRDPEPKKKNYIIIIDLYGQDTYRFYRYIYYWIKHWYSKGCKKYNKK